MEGLRATVAKGVTDLCTSLDREVKYLDENNQGNAALRNVALMIIKQSDTSEGCHRKGEEYDKLFGSGRGMMFSRDQYVENPSGYLWADIDQALTKAREDQREVGESV